MIFLERSLPNFSPREAAVLAGVPLQRIQNALTVGRLGPRRPTLDGRRRVDLAALLAFALGERLGKIKVEPSLLYDRLRKVGIPRRPLALTDSVTVDAPHLLGSVVRNLVLYREATDWIVVSDRVILGGVPVIRGTRIPARTIHGRVKSGEPAAEVRADYPYLTRRQIDAAVLYVEANPPRGRPPRRSRR
jgi:uncharacterized protein (DUF433 family)